MTVSSTARRAGPFTGTGALVNYPFTFKVFSGEDLKVVVTDLSDTATELVLGSTLLVTLNPDQDATPGGYVNYAAGGVAAALPSGYTLVMTGENLAFEQIAELPQGGNFNPESVEAALDRGIMLAQLLLERYARTLSFPSSDNGGGELPAVAVRKGTILGFDAATGAPVATIPASGSAADVLLQLANSASALLGPTLVAYNPALSYTAGSVGARLREELTTSGFASLQDAVTAAAGKRLLVLGSHTITSAITVLSDTEIVLTPGSEVNTSTADISHFNCTGRSNVRIYGPGKIKKTGTGTAAYVAGVLLTSASNCIVYGVEFEGMQWAGIFMKDATNCHAVRNYIHDHLGSIQDAAGVYVSDDSLACHVDGNRIVNSGWHGVAVLDTDATAGVVPVGTHVCDNEISGQTAYGVVVYELSADNSDTLVFGNRIRDVTGVNPTGAGGAGIYVQNSGGVRVIGNVVRNVCLSTSSAALTPAGIAVNNAGASLVPAVVSANTITNVGITSGGTPNSSSLLLSGINVSSSTSGADVYGNVIVQAALTTPTFAGLYCNATSNYSATGNKISLYTSGSACVGIFAYANGANIAGINLVANEVVGGTSGGQYILITNSGGFTVSGISISGGVYRGAGSGCRGLQIEGGVGASIAGAQIYATGEAVYLNGTTKARFSGCALESSGSTAILTAGTCTDSYMDASNYWGTSASAMNNGGTGFRVEWIGGTSAPAAGTWAVNDRTIRGTQAVGSPKAWVCTVAGTSGTHTSEGNL